MQNNLIKYNHYKPSGVQWLGDIPEHWEVKPGFTIISERKEKNIGLKINTVLSLSYGNVIIKPEEKLTGLVPESFETYQIVYPNDIIIRPTDLQNDKTSLRTGLAKNHGIITSAYINILVKKGNNSSYLHYFFHCVDITKVIYGLGSGLRQNLDFRDFKRFSFLVPPLLEQTAIAQFLDRKTAQIEVVISQKQRMIELLKERRQILIHQAVTRGLHPDVPMKASGVEWIGEIPEHWEVKKLNYLAQVGNGSTPNRSNPKYWQNGTIPWLNSSKVNDERIKDADQFITPTALKECHLPMLTQGTIVIAITGEGKTRGMVALCEIIATINQHLAFIKVTSSKITSIFLLQYLQAMYVNIRADSSGLGSTKGAITCSVIKEYKVPIPTISEQTAIVNYIETATQKIDKAIGLKEQEIEKLKEYKASLINSVVTGKVKVTP